MDFITWEARYNVNIPMIDEQHIQLIKIINALYNSCTVGDKVTLEAGFKSAVKETVDYVKKHFSDEEQLMRSCAYPDYTVHKGYHEEFVKRILETVSQYLEGKNFTVNNFVRFLTDWLLEHIAIKDKEFARYYFSCGNK